MLNAGALSSGTPVGQSVSVDAEVEGIPLTVAKVSCARVADEPGLWTFIDLEVTADRAAGLAGALSRVLEREGGWYRDFRSDDEVVVVFCDRVLSYRRGDRAARSAAEDYAVYGSPGIPARLPR
jgi:hypothetical protein